MALTFRDLFARTEKRWSRLSGVGRGPHTATESSQDRVQRQGSQSAFRAQQGCWCVCRSVPPVPVSARRVDVSLADMCVRGPLGPWAWGLPPAWHGASCLLVLAVGPWSWCHVSSVHCLALERLRWSLVLSLSVSHATRDTDQHQAARYRYSEISCCIAFCMTSCCVSLQLRQYMQHATPRP